MLRFILLVILAAFGFMPPHACRARDAVLEPELVSLNDGIIAYAVADFTEAFQLLAPLAEMDISVAQLLVGKMYADGRGVARNCEQELYWLKQASKGGNAEAAFELGLLHEEGRCVAKSHLVALEWYILADENGSTAAANAVGEIYLGGGDVAPDFKKAASWFFRAASDYNAGAYCHLGELYVRGVGVQRDLVEAYKWYDLCAEISLPKQMGEPTDAAMERDRIREQLLPFLASEGHKRAAEYMADSYHRDDRTARGRVRPSHE